MSRDLPYHHSDEERIAADMARELEAMTMTSSVQPSEGFADRVMLAIADEPLPQPVRAFGLALLGGHLRAAIGAVGDAWRTISSAPAPLAVRAQALALVLVVLVGSLAVAGGATVGAIDLLTANPPAPSPSGPPPSAPIPTSSPPPPSSADPEESPSESPDESAGEEATETPEHETDRPTVRPRTATPTAHETEDHSGGGDGSGEGGGSGSGTDSSTPNPTETNDSGGGDG